MMKDEENERVECERQFRSLACEDPDLAQAIKEQQALWDLAVTGGDSERRSLSMKRTASIGLTASAQQRPPAPPPAPQ